MQVKMLKFKESDLKLAREIVDDYLFKHLDVNPNAAGFEAVPNHIGFYFLADKNGMTAQEFAKLKFTDTELEDDDCDQPGFGVFISDDLHNAEAHMQYLVNHFTPYYLAEIAENTFTIQLDEGEKISALDVFKDLVSRGFFYESGSCDLGDYFRTITIK